MHLAGINGSGNAGALGVGMVPMERRVGSQSTITSGRKISRAMGGCRARRIIV